MTFQAWSVIFIVPALSSLLFLQRILGTRSIEAKSSKQYYTYCLALIVVWPVLDFTLTNLPADSSPLPGIINRAIFLVVSLVVFFFVASAIDIAPPKAPVSRRVRLLFSSSPVVFILLTYSVDPFRTSLTRYGWQGDISDPALRYSWLGLIVAVMAFSFLILLGTRSRVTDQKARKSLTFFLYGHVLALIVGVALYLIGEVVNIPIPSSVGVGLSILLAYPAFSPRRAPT